MKNIAIIVILLSVLTSCATQSTCFNSNKKVNPKTGLYGPGGVR